MDLLDEPLPVGGLHSDVHSAAFFDRCEAIAADRDWTVDRRRRYAGDGYDQLNLHLRGGEEPPFVRMVMVPNGKGRIGLDVVANWSSHPIPCLEYRETFLALYRELLDAYKERHKARPRIHLGPCPTHFDRSTVNCPRLSYSQGKFREATRSMAVGAGDIRERLRDAYLILHVIQANELPEPLRPHYEWVVSQLTWRPARYQHQGTLDATIWQMRRSTGAKIAKRIQAVSDALEELCPRDD